MSFSVCPCEGVSEDKLGLERTMKSALYLDLYTNSPNRPDADRRGESRELVAVAGYFSPNPSYVIHRRMDSGVLFEALR